jgi:hypothetical protein
MNGNCQSVARAGVVAKLLLAAAPAETACIAAALAVALSAGGASAKNISSCSLIVDGKQFINGPCEFSPLGDGSFKIMKGPWFAYVNLHSDQRNSADGYWNENPQSNHAESSLGVLVRSGECWSNERAMICAKE